MKTKMIAKISKMNTKILVVFILNIISFSTFSCEPDDRTEIPEQRLLEQSVDLNEEAANLEIGEEIVLTAQFDPDYFSPVRTYEWVSSDPGVASVTSNENYSATVTANQPGSASISIASTDGVLQAVSEITVNEPYEDDGIIKVLAIGNSFSEDAVENYLYDLAEAEGIPIMIGDLVIGGASLDLHWNNASSNSNAYSYRKIDTEGNKTTTGDMSIQSAIYDEDWDFISFQQVSSSSGLYDTFITPLPALVEYARERTTHPDVKFLLHQTWAYAQNSTHSGFANYDNDQQVMYESLVDAIRSAQELAGMDYVVPSGTAIQNARTSLIGDNLTRDGYHLDLNLGRYIAASTWFEALTGEHVEGNPYKPEALTDFEAELAQYAAHYAIIQPDEVTEMVDYQAANAGPPTNPIFINFGLASENGWNTVSSWMDGTEITSLKDEHGNYTSVSLSIVERFNNRNSVGASQPTTPFDIPGSVGNDSFYGNSKGAFGGFHITQSRIKFSGFDQDETYDFCFFGARTSVSDNRETKYIATGENEVAVTLQTANNTSEVACANGIIPDVNGEITITVTAGENNSNSLGFYYINAMNISVAE